MGQRAASPEDPMKSASTLSQTARQPLSERQSEGAALTSAAVIGLFLTALVTSWLAAFDPRVGWAAAAFLAIVVGAVLTGTRARWLALALIPVSMLTSSAVVPFEGRYIPMILLTGALLIAMRGRIGAATTLLQQYPRSLVVSVLAYLAWATVVTVTSVSIGEIQYLVGMVATLGVALVATPILISSETGLRRLFAVVTISAATLLASGLVLATLGGITIFGRSVGVYFIEELVLAGRPTGIVFPQNYGPFVGPATEPLAFAIATSSYLAATARGRARWTWWALGAFCLLGLASSFSREGILMAALATGTVAFGWLLAGRGVSGALIVTGVLALFLAGSLTGAIGVLGRLDLVRAWYGGDAVATLMNPIIADRGRVPIEPGGQVDGPGPTPGAGPSSPPGTGAPIPDVIELKTTGSFQARLSLWRAAYEASLEAPLFGHGLGSNADVIVPYLQGEDARLRGASVHSTVMRMLVELGIPGLATYLAVIATAVWLAARAVWRAPRVILPLAGIVVASLAHQLFGTLLLGGLTYGSFVFAVALGCVTRSAARPGRLRAGRAV
jgi:hypothetical protein